MTSRKDDKETVPRDQDAKESKTIASVPIEWNDRMEVRVEAPSLDMGIANTAGKQNTMPRVIWESGWEKKRSEKGRNPAALLPPPAGPILEPHPGVG